MLNQERIIKIAENIDSICEVVDDLPSQYKNKIHELLNTVLSVVAMADGVHVKTIDVRDLADGTHEIDGVSVTKKDGKIQLGKAE